MRAPPFAPSCCAGFTRCPLSCWNNVFRLRSRCQPSFVLVACFPCNTACKNYLHNIAEGNLDFTTCTLCTLFLMHVPPIEVCSRCQSAFALVGCCTDVLRFAFETHLGVSPACVDLHCMFPSHTPHFHTPHMLHGIQNSKSQSTSPAPPAIFFHLQPHITPTTSTHPPHPFNFLCTSHPSPQSDSHP